MGTTNSPTEGSSTVTQLPPGMILGPDGKPCKACTAFRVWRKNPPKKPSGDSSSSTSSASSSTLASGSTAATVASSIAAIATGDENAGPPPGCPPDVEQLGRSTWTFLHTTAAYYPEKPTPTQRSSMLSLLKALPALYPCSYCASHLSDNLKQHPITEHIVSGRGPLSRWLCERHNDVNVRLGKSVFDCSKTDERWKDGPPDGSCD